MGGLGVGVLKCLGTDTSAAVVTLLDDPADFICTSDVSRSSLENHFEPIAEGVVPLRNVLQLAAHGQLKDKTVNKLVHIDMFDNEHGNFSCTVLRLAVQSAAPPTDAKTALQSLAKSAVEQTLQSYMKSAPVVPSTGNKRRTPLSLDGWWYSEAVQRWLRHGMRLRSWVGSTSDGEERTSGPSSAGRELKSRSSPAMKKSSVRTLSGLFSYPYSLLFRKPTHRPRINGSGGSKTMRNKEILTLSNCREDIMNKVHAVIDK